MENDFRCKSTVGAFHFLDKQMSKMATRVLLFVLFWGSFDLGGQMALCLPKESKGCNFPAVFNLGDSNSDTGGLVAGLGLDAPLPNGQSFFHGPSGRFCDGRLVIDFLCEALSLPLLSPYMESVGSDFSHGANFAVAGSTVLSYSGGSPFPLSVQVNQFRHFKARVADILTSPDKVNVYGKFLPPKNAFDNALYTIDIGQNDITNAFRSNLREDEVNALIPQIIQGIAFALKRLYEEGGRNFWVHNTGPSGCLPRTLAEIRKDLSKVDEYGCVVAYNKAAQTFNLQLQNVCSALRKQLSNATIVYVDIYSAKYDLIANASQYGFEHPLAACCGYGGLPYNFDDNLRCANTATVNGTLVTAGACKDPTKYVSWDGIHYSEAANIRISAPLLSGKLSDPPLAPCQIGTPRI